MSAPRTPERPLWAFAVLLAALHVLDPRDPREALVSEFAFAQPVLTGVAFVLLGTGIALTGVALARARRARRWRFVPALALVAAGLGFALLAAFPTDHRGTVEATTPTGRIHDRLAGTSALLLTFASLLAWAALSVKRAALFFVAVNLAFWLPAVLAPASPGLFQRTWLGAVIAGLIPLSRAAAASRGS